jgi:transcriptional antiterminator NusG
VTHSTDHPHDDLTADDSAAPSEAADDAVASAPAGDEQGDESTDDASGSDADAGDAAESDEAEEVVVRSRPSDDDSDEDAKPLYEDLGRPEATGIREWFIVKVQSNREESVKQALLRRVRIAGLEGFFGDVIVPTETVVEFRAGKKRSVKRKLYPGYIVVHLELNEDTWFLVRETPGIGDFTGSAGKPTPMLPHEVQRIVSKGETKADEAPKLKIAFNIGDRVKINEGTFDNFEGEVESIDQANGRVTVMINIFGRSTPVQLEYWQVEPV